MFRKGSLFFVLFLASLCTVKASALEQPFHFHPGQKYVDMEFLKRLSNSELLLDIFSTSLRLLYQSAVYTNDTIVSGVVYSSRIAAILLVVFIGLRKSIGDLYSKLRQKIIDKPYIGTLYVQLEGLLSYIAKEVLNLIYEPFAPFFDKKYNEMLDFMNEIRGRVDTLNARIEVIGNDVDRMGLDCIDLKKMFEDDTKKQKECLFLVEEKISTMNMSLNVIENTQNNMSENLDVQIPKLKELEINYLELQTELTEQRNELTENCKKTIRELEKKVHCYYKDITSLREDSKKMEGRLQELNDEFTKHEKQYQKVISDNQVINERLESACLKIEANIIDFEKQNNDSIQVSNKYSIEQIMIVCTMIGVSYGLQHHMQKASVNREIPLDRSLEDVLAIKNPSSKHKPRD